MSPVKQWRGLLQMEREKKEGEKSPKIRDEPEVQNSAHSRKVTTNDENGFCVCTARGPESSYDRPVIRHRLGTSSAHSPHSSQIAAAVRRELLPDAVIGWYRQHWFHKLLSEGQRPLSRWTAVEHTSSSADRPRVQ